MRNNDPTRKDMLAFLARGEFDEFDCEEAIYWFANNWHSGQWSNLYSALSTSPFNPGPFAGGPEENARYLVEMLEAEFIDEDKVSVARTSLA